MEQKQTFNKLDFKISQEEVKNAILKIKNNKSPGLDNITNEMIKTWKNILTPVLAKIFNTALLCGKFPTSWTRGIIVPIFKYGNATDPGNYRGITLNSCLGKLFTIILNNRLTEYTDKHKIIPPNQIGFKKKARTSDHLFVIRTLIEKVVKTN